MSHASSGSVDCTDPLLIQGWRRIRGDAPLPRVVRLKREKSKKVYRLFEPGGTRSLIAKRSTGDECARERSIYEEILPGLSLPSLTCYGTLDESDGACSWIFLEDVGDESISPRNLDGSLDLVLDWLARAHCSSTDLGLKARLPDRGPVHYRNILGSATDLIRAGVGTNEALDRDDVNLLQELLSRCVGLERRWPEIEQRCSPFPAGLVHGDFVAKNLRVQKSRTGPTLRVLDWATAGWGVPAADIASIANLVKELPQGLQRLYSTMAEVWPGRSTTDLQGLHRAGEVFRWTAGVYWASQSLVGAEPAPAIRTLHYAMKHHVD